jgi:hypothetical protein
MLEFESCFWTFTYKVLLFYHYAIYRKYRKVKKPKKIYTLISYAYEILHNRLLDIRSLDVHKVLLCYKDITVERIEEDAAFLLYAVFSSKFNGITTYLLRVQ